MNSLVMERSVLLILFLCIGTLHANLCQSNSNDGSLECCPGYYWNKIEYRCIKCDAGTIGPRCETRCQYPNYGFLCVLNCSCSEDDCDFADGCPDWTSTFISSVNKNSDVEFITKDAPTSNSNPGDDTCQEEETKEHVYSPFSQNMRVAIISLLILAVFMFIIYVGLVRNKTKYTLRGPSSTNNTYCITV